MKTKFKILITIICVLLAMLLSMTGVMAYMTATSADINIFTLGNVSLKLDEAKVNPDGTAVPNAERVMKNEYHLLPGCTYLKDPTVTVEAESEEAYVRMILKIYNASAVQAIIDDSKNGLSDYSDLIGGWDETAWIYKGFTEDEEENMISFEFRYKQIEDGCDENGAEADNKLPALFTELIVPDTLTAGELQKLKDNGFKMEVAAHAIQASGFENEDKAWEAFEKQMK